MLQSMDKLLPPYVVNLGTHNDLKPDTIRNAINRIFSCSKWYLLFASNLRTFKTHETNLIFNQVDVLCHHLSRSYARAQRKHRAVNNKDTIDYKILNRQWPKNGLKGLQNTIQEEKTNWVDKQDGFEDLIPTASVINRFTAFLFAAIICGTVQGRISGLTNVTLAQGRRMFEEDNSVAMTDQFKTSSTFGWQVIMVPTWTKPYGVMWMDTIRPKILESLSRSRAKELMAPDAPLFIKVGGGPVCGSNLVSSFFREKCGLNMGR
jgi:hypothetical protein